MKLLEGKPCLHHRSPVKVAIVTGLSNPRSTQLNRAQLDFLDELPIAEECKIRRNFPFVETKQAKQTDRSLLIASYHNTFQFLTSGSRRNRTLAAPHWKALVDSTDHVLLITGSCGLQLASLMPASGHRMPKLDLLALGPVSIERDVSWDDWHEFTVTRIRGSRDWISGMFGARCDHLVSGLGHMEYWYNSEVREIASNWLLNKTSESLGPEAAFPASS